MKDNQKKYLDKVVDMIVRDTRISYSDTIEDIYFPFTYIKIARYFFLSPPLTSSLTTPIFQYFSKHCKNTYGIDVDEIEYVWNKYITIIKEKIL